MTLSRSPAYLRYVRVETRLHIVLLVAMLAVLFLPSPRESMASVLLAGMILRAWSCGVVPASISRWTGPVSILILPFWPAYVAVDSISRWMLREGFGAAFRIAVPAVFLSVTWIALVEPKELTPGILILLSSAASAMLRQWDSPWYVLPSAVPLVFMKPML